MPLSRRAKRVLSGLGLLAAVLAAGVGLLYIRYRPQPPVFDTIYTGHRMNVSAVVFTPDGRRFITDGWDSQAMLWEPDETWPIRVLGKGQAALHDLALSPDGTTVFAVGDDPILYRWRTAANPPIAAVPLSGPAKHVAVSPDGGLLAVSSADGTVTVIDARTGKTHYRIMQTRGGKGALAFAPDGRTLAVADGRGVLLVNPATGQGVRRFDAPEVHWLRFAPDGKTLVVAGYYSDLILIHTATWKERARLPLRFVTDAVYSPDSRVLFTVEETSLWRRDGGTGADPMCIAGSCRDPNLPRWMTRLMPFLGSPRKEQLGPLALSPDGKTLLYASDAVVKRIKL